MTFLKPSQMKRRRHDVVDGIQYRLAKSTNEMQEFCITGAARERRRREIFDRDKQRCVKCGRRLRFEADELAPDRMHWHHKKHRSLGGDDSMKNGQSLCPACHLVDEHHHI